MNACALPFLNNFPVSCSMSETHWQRSGQTGSVMF
jgi:hypothetical protein